MREKILLIGMLDSVHLANWLERIQFIDRDIYLYPSRKYRKLHPKIMHMLRENSSIKVIKFVPSKRITVYLEFLLDTTWFHWLHFFSRKNRLNRLLYKNQFSKIHAIEIQHAAYLLASALPCEMSFNNIIVTNWGSDIYYYSQFPEHAKKIRESLVMADFYSAECSRDYDLARNFGFTGIDLPLVPNSTTFSEEHFKQSFLSPSHRYQIIMKCYGSTFGHGEILLEIAHDVLLARSELSIYAYSVTEELIPRAENLRKMFTSVLLVSILDTTSTSTRRV
jgi:hypothetical protein